MELQLWATTAKAAKPETVLSPSLRRPLTHRRQSGLTDGQAKPAVAAKVSI